MAAMSSRPRPTILCEFGTLRAETSSLLSPARDPCCVALLHQMGGQFSPGINQVEATSCDWKDWSKRFTLLRSAQLRFAPLKSASLRSGNALSFSLLAFHGRN